MNNGYAICLNEWLDDTTISNELNLLLRISSLTAEKGHCFASNDYLSEKVGVNSVNVSRKIKKLESLGYIEIEYEKRGSEIKSRKIRLSKMITDRYQKKQPTVIKNDKDNSTSINSIYNREEGSSKLDEIKNNPLFARERSKLNNMTDGILDEAIELILADYPTIKFVNLFSMLNDRNIKEGWKNSQNANKKPEIKERDNTETYNGITKKVKFD